MTAATVTGTGAAPARARNWGAALLAVVVSLAMLALIAVRPVPGGGAGGSSQQFRQDYAAVLATFRADTERLRQQGQALVGTSTERVLPIYEQLRNVSERAAQRLAALQPPAEARAGFEVLVDLLRQQTLALGAVVREARRGATTQLAAALQHYAVLVADWLTAQQQLAGALR